MDGNSREPQIPKPAERLAALQHLSLLTGIGSLAVLGLHPLLVVALLPLSVYFLYHGAIALGWGQGRAVAAGFLGLIPVVNAVLLFFLHNRLRDRLCGNA